MLVQHLDFRFRRKIRYRDGCLGRHRPFIVIHGEQVQAAGVLPGHHIQLDISLGPDRHGRHRIVAQDRRRQPSNLGVDFPQGRAVLLRHAELVIGRLPDVREIADGRRASADGHPDFGLDVRGRDVLLILQRPGPLAAFAGFNPGVQWPLPRLLASSSVASWTR